MKKKYLLLLLCVPLLVTGCGKVPELQNGQQVIVEVNGKQFTAEEFFDELKDDYGTSVLVNLVSNYIADQEITEESAEEAKERAQSEYDRMYAYYGSNWNQVLASNNYANGEQLLKDLENSYRQSLVLEQYIKTDVITEEEIQEYYDNDIFGDSSVRHILIIPEVDDDMDEDEEEEAKRKALEEATEIIETLQNSENLEEDFSEIAKDQSDDTGTASEGGLLENINSDSGLAEEFWEASRDLNVGEFTTEPIETEFGYHIIYKVSQKDKPTLNEVRDTILDNLVDELLSEENASIIYWAGLREKYNMVIHDDTIKNNYEGTLKQYQ